MTVFGGLRDKACLERLMECIGKTSMIGKFSRWQVKSRLQRAGGGHDFR